MTLAQVCGLLDEEAAMRTRAKRKQTRGEERPGTLADAMMLARVGLTPPAG